MANVRVEKEGRVAVVTLDRPPVNALDQVTFVELTQTFEAFAHDRSVSAAILTAPGEKIFCGGVDLKDSPIRFRPDGRPEAGAPQFDAAQQVDPGLLARNCFNSIYDCAVPVIAAVNGIAIGAGLALVASADMIVASSTAGFALKEITVGVLGGVRHAQRLAGPWLSKRMFLTGDTVSAHDLYRAGSIDSVVAPDELLSAARELAERIVVNSPIAVRLAKESANRVEGLDLKDGYRLEQDYTIRVRRHADADEARAAFLEKRVPEFRWE
jgi:enoyl-CoA hydratase